VTTISIRVDDEAAQAFTEAPFEERRKLELLLDLRLRELVGRPTRPLHQIMDEVGTQAIARGLTPEGLDALLHGN
jgi:hypothetical protein